ncbi:Epoxyqueuosine (oQ) reductase QueG [methanotrophic endosymbiont of Bathymodiolus puteoserpentis (Logatchev)]|jgi:epoxyqueuosine reductase|nr:Epoxyqueuosine (oQ) reductase QueG [methanotrophic endosymbiont of Bathymodiolus puteoserpentis (Logatchev)]
MDKAMNELSQQIKHWGLELGFQQVGITDTDLHQAEQRLQHWLAQGYHADMEYMHKHGLKRSRPALLQPETVSIISVRMDYLPEAQEPIENTLNNPVAGFISRYALGRDYHKVLRKRLQKLAQRIEQEIGIFGYRAFVDSAPVLEKAIAEKAGLGWIGKHSNIINKKAGSWFFLGEIYTSIPLTIDSPSHNHCGQCTACINICPTQAIIAPYQVDARKCISYLTIELKGSIPEALRSLMGNRIYGCDDCQLICPWNRFARLSTETDFSPRYNLNAQHLIELFNWSETEFLTKTEGSAIRRIGYEQWQRNIAVALGNAPASTEIKAVLNHKISYHSELVKEHVLWALKQEHVLKQ